MWHCNEPAVHVALTGIPHSTITRHSLRCKKNRAMDSCQHERATGEQKSSQPVLSEAASSQGKVSSTDLTQPDWLLITWTDSSPMTMCRLLLSYKKGSHPYHSNCVLKGQWIQNGTWRPSSLVSPVWEMMALWLLFCWLEPKCQPECLNLRFHPVIKSPDSWNPKILIIIIASYIMFSLTRLSDRFVSAVVYWLHRSPHWSLWTGAEFNR